MSNKQLHQEILTLLKIFQPSPIGIALTSSNHKKELRSFIDYFRRENPKVTTSDAKLLLLGKGRGKKGLLNMCGNKKTSDNSKLSGTALVSLTLVAYLLDHESNDSAAEFTSILEHIPLPTVLSMKLGKYIVSMEGDSRDQALFIIKTLVKHTNLDPVQFVLPGAALGLYEEWIQEKEESDPEEKAPPSVWGDVKLMNIDAWEQAQDVTISLPPLHLSLPLLVYTYLCLYIIYIYIYI